MRATGGPGIIPFELAGSATRAEDIMTRWGSDGQRAATLPYGSISDYMRNPARHTDGLFSTASVGGMAIRAALPATVTVPPAPPWTR